MDKPRVFPPQLFVFIDHDEEGEWPIAHAKLEEITPGGAADRVAVYELRSVNAFDTKRTLTPIV
jgi:hypothetical protein